jgi:hypothetical protein
MVDTMSIALLWLFLLWICGSFPFECFDCLTVCIDNKMALNYLLFVFRLFLSYYFVVLVSHWELYWLCYRSVKSVLRLISPGS